MVRRQIQQHLIQLKYMLKKWFLQYWRLISGLVILGAIATPLALNLYVNTITKNYRYTEATKTASGEARTIFE